MSAKDLIVKWEEAVEGALEREPLEAELSDEDFDEAAVGVATKSALRSGRTMLSECGQC
jgi:hypothetical protein